MSPEFLRTLARRCAGDLVGVMEAQMRGGEGEEREGAQARQGTPEKKGHEGA